MATCRVCKKVVVQPHCEHPQCPWCRECVDRRRSEREK